MDFKIEYIYFKENDKNQPYDIREISKNEYDMAENKLRPTSISDYNSKCYFIAGGIINEVNNECYINVFDLYKYARPNTIIEGIIKEIIRNKKIKQILPEQDMIDKLNNYANGKIHYTPIMNFKMNNRLGELGKYIVSVIDIQKVPELSFLSDEVNSFKTKVKDFLGIERVYSSISIFFLTSALDADSLSKMFGEPIFHDEFGEGFDGEFDEELDDFLEPEIKESYASYFVTINNVDLHIGYDHRGTSIEVNIKNPITKKLDFEPSDQDSELMFKTLKELVNLYKENCY